MWKDLQPFFFWCQKVLPLTYDNSLSYVEVLYKVVDYLNHVIEDVNQIPDYIRSIMSEESLKQILSGLLDELREQIASSNEKESDTATHDIDKGEYVWVHRLLYRATRDILAGDRYVTEGGDDITPNLEKITIEEMIKDTFTTLEGLINDETTARENADTTLQGNINAEATARDQADTAIVTQLTEALQSAVASQTEALQTEVAAREQADTIITTQWTQALQTEVAAREQADTTITMQYKQFVRSNNVNSGKFIIFVGDSYADPNVENDTYVTRCANFMGLQQSQYINASVGGAGFSNGAFLTLLTNAVESLSDPNIVTDVVVIGGYNDYSATLGDILNAINTFCTYCKTNLPYAKIQIGIVGNDRDHATITEAISTTVYSAYSQCAMYGATFINNLECIMHNYQLFANQVHPNTAGYLTIALYLANYLTGGDCHVRFNKSNAVISSMASGVTFQNFGFRETMDNDKIYIPANNFLVLFDSPKNFVYGTNIELCTLEPLFAKGSNDPADSYILCNAYYSTSGTEKELPNTYLYIYGNKLYLGANIPVAISVGALRLQILPTVLDTIMN